MSDGPDLNGWHRVQIPRRRLMWWRWLNYWDRVYMYLRRIR